MDWHEYQDDHFKNNMKERNKHQKRKLLFSIEFQGGIYQILCNATQPEYSDFVGIGRTLIFKQSKRWSPENEICCYYLQVTGCTAKFPPLLSQDEYFKEGYYEKKQQEKLRRYILGR